MIYTCPFCRSMFEMGGDHSIEPCAPCFKAGYRIDSMGNKIHPATDRNGNAILYAPHVRVDRTGVKT